MKTALLILLIALLFTCARKTLFSSIKEQARYPGLNVEPRRINKMYTRILNLLRKDTLIKRQTK